MEKLPPKQRIPKGVRREELLNLSKEELVDRLIQIEAHNVQLKNIISKKVSNESAVENQSSKNQKKFDFSKHHTRHILLHILYFGWDYHGFVVQEDSNKTIEHHIFNALTRACLIESRETADYHRCGRTDKGVSAFGQVISLNIRSKHPPEEQNTPEALSSELSYCKILNRLLPGEIRAVAWLPVPHGFSARFDCKKRQYKYYFPRSSLDISSMRLACSSLVGSHDFRNLCKMDVGNGVTEFRRHILTADVVAVDDDDLDRPTSMYYLLIEGNAFLWHQIRCIQAILLLVGSGQESPDVVAQLLDHEQYDRKPQYSLAIDAPLNLFACTYVTEAGGRWQSDADELARTIHHYQAEWTLHSVKATMFKDCLQTLQEKYAKIKEQQHTDGSPTDNYKIIAYHECLTEGVKPKNYTPLMKRVTCSSLEEKIEHYKKRRKQYESDESSIVENKKK